MNTKISNSLTNLIKFIALSIYCISVLLIYIEIFSFSGFTVKYFDITLTDLILFTTFSSIIYTIFTAISNIKSKFFQILYKISLIHMVIAFLSYGSFSILESQNYSNYVFTRYHVHYKLILYLMSVTIITVLSFSVMKHIDKFKKYYTEYKLKPISTLKKLSNKALVLLSILLSLIIFGKYILNLAITLYTSNRVIMKKLHTSYDDLIIQYWGDEYNYWKFLVDKTPDNAVIYVPPQEFPWGTIGNVGLVRYFLYPRRIKNLEWGKIPDDKSAYIVVSWGDWSAEASKYGWPKIEIPAKGTWYYHKNKDPEYIDGKYVPMYLDGVHTWGVIMPSI